MTNVIFIFVNLLVLTVTGTLLALRFNEKRARRQVALRLGVSGKPEPCTVDLLRTLEKSDEEHKERRSLNIMPYLADMLTQADLDWPAARLLKIMAMLATAGLVAGAIFPVVLSRLISMACFSVGGAALPYLYVRRTLQRRMSKLEAQLPDAMDFLARSMRAGHAFSISLGMVGDDLPDPLGREFRSLFNEHNLGAPLEVAFAGFLRRVPMLDAKLFCSAAILQRKTGGNLSELLLRLSEVVRDRFRLRAQVKATSAHGRMTAGILSSMPLLTMIALLIVAPGYLQGLWNDEDGRKLIGAAVVAQLLGNLTIRKIVRIRV